METLLKTPNLGTGILEDRDRVKFTELRQQRSERVFALMDRLGLDALVLGREDNVRYASGARRLWTSMSRPFGPTCLVVRRTRRVHLLTFSASYEGMPEELQPDEMFPVTWNPMTVVERFRSTEGVEGATAVGVDGLSFLFDGLLRMAFPGAELVGIQPDLLDVRRVKLAEEIVCLRIAAATAEAALAATVGTLRPGVSGKELQARYLERMCELGTSQFAQQGTFAAVGPGGALDMLTSRDPIPDGAMVALAGGVLWSGYEGSLARTWWCGRREPGVEARSLHARWRDRLDAVVERCRPGSTGADLAAALGADRHDAVYSIGIGHEGVLAAPWLGQVAMERQALVAGMVLGVRSFVAGDTGGVLAEEMVLVTDDGPELLTTLGHGPLDDRPV